MRIIKRSVAMLLFLPLIAVTALADWLMDGNQAGGIISFIWER